MTYGQVRRSTIDAIFVIAAVAAVVGLRAALEPVLGGTAPLIFFLLPVATSAWFGGFWPGVAATLLGGALGLWLFAPDTARITPHSPLLHWFVRGGPFFIVGLFISFFAARLERARLAAIQGQRDLHASEERQRQIFESAKDFAIFTVDPNGVVTSWNAGAERLFGHSRQEIIGQTADPLWTPEDRVGGVPGDERRRAAEGEGVEDRRWHQRRDGTRFFANGTMRSIRDKSGDLIGFVKVCRDDTARLLGEEERAHLAEQRRLALDAARLGWWQMDLATGWGVVDEGFARIFGVPSGPIDVEASKALLHPDDRDRVAAAVEATLRPENAQPYEIEYRIRRPDGPVRWIAATGRVIYGDGAGPPRPVSFVGTVADITEAKAAAMALAASEASFRELADAMPQIVFAATPDGHVDYFNRQWYDYTGLPEGAIGFEHWQHVHKPDMLPEVTRVWQVALAAGSTYELEYPLRRHDGQFRWHLGRARPVKDDSGRVVRWFGTNTDIHDQKRLREEAEAARRHAEEAGRLKDEFLATVSHELRTPLSAIVGWSHLLEGGRSDPATLNEGLSVIHRNAQAQSQLIEDILDVSRITTGKLRLHSRPVGLREPIEAAIATVRTAADAKGVAVALDLDGNTRLLGDPDRLQQIFWNLLANAIKFTPPGGRVAVRQWREETRAVVTVADTGRGIGPEFLPYVFDRFRQADMTTTRRHGGLGLGLSIVRHLVDLHGGHVSVTSDGDGHGSTFRVDLPLHAAVPSDAETPASDQAGPNGSTSTPLKGRRVLVLEDEVDTRRVLEAALTRDGAAVASASSVQDAMDLLAREDSFDAVVSDIGLPDEDGYAFVRRLRAGEAERGSPRLPAIALTAYTRTSDRSAVLAAGFDLFLPKPVSPSELRVALLELLG